MTETLRRVRQHLYEPRDAAGIAAFRILFGLVMLVSALRTLAYGWVEEFYVEPRFFFKYWGFEWVDVLPAPYMVAAFVALAMLSALIALGLFYRASIALFFLLFTYVQLIDVTYYLNHYYLVSLLALLLNFVPAHRTWSLDARLRPRLHVTHLPAWCTYLLRFQVGVVYGFAGLAKLQSDWLIHAQPLNIWLSSRSGLPLIGPILALPFMAHVMSWAGFLFDTTIVGWLSFDRTRRLAYVALLVFHTLTGLLFPIGMFPAIMTVSALIFFPASWPRRLLKLAIVAAVPVTPPEFGFWRRAAFALAVAWCAVHVLIPLRHRLYGGDVLWHEQGMRFAWKVMVREKNANVTFRVRQRGSEREWLVRPDAYLTDLQQREMSTQPDLIVQLARHVADEYRKRGKGEVEVRVDAEASLNGRFRAPLIDPDVDLARVELGLWPAFYILRSPESRPPRLTAVAAR